MMTNLMVAAVVTLTEAVVRAVGMSRRSMTNLKVAAVGVAYL